MRGLNQEIVKFIEQLEGVKQYSTAGSFRRYKEMSKDLDFIISTSEPKKFNNNYSVFRIKSKMLLLGILKFLELAYDDETIGVDFRLIEPAAFTILYNTSPVRRIIILE